MANAWIKHVMATKAEMARRGTFKKGDNLSKAIMEAKKTYKRSSSAGPKARKTRRHRKSRKSMF
jgi:hypothetical protein